MEAVKKSNISSCQLHMPKSVFMHNFFFDFYMPLTLYIIFLHVSLPLIIAQEHNNYSVREFTYNNFNCLQSCDARIEKNGSFVELYTLLAY